MGRKWKRKNKNKHNGKGEPRDADNGDQGGKDEEAASNMYHFIEQGNFKMEAYYAYQGIHDDYLVKETHEDEETNTVGTTGYKFVECKTSEQKEEERQRWLNTMKTILPASFRIGNDVDPDLRQRLEHEIDKFAGQKMHIEVESRGGTRVPALTNDNKPEIKYIAPAQKLRFVPHAYQLSLDRQTIRRNQALEPFHEWLKVQTQAGFITRQETVSMIPPVVLDPRSHHIVLDMAAAPGSKTSQLLEIVNLPCAEGDHEPKGCVVANDSDVKRAYMLVNQMRRINSPAIFITSCDARFFPLLKEHPQNGEVAEGIFDRVLCDVPCSGDGTARKNPGIWKNWNSLNGYALHPMQLAIGLRGLQSTKVGGYMCYSTCSMNPIENEAVVAELLRASEGSVQLVERRSMLPGLVARPGLTTWKVLAETKSNKQIKDYQKKNNEKMIARRKEWEEKKNREGSAKSTQTENVGLSDVVATSENETAAQDLDATMKDEDNTSTNNQEQAEEQPFVSVSIRTKFEPKSLDDKELLKSFVESAGMTEYASYDDVPKNMRKRIRLSCFPPSSTEVAVMNLEHCMRVMPQDMDTGGFFVALFEKISPLNSRARKRFQALQEILQRDELDDEGCSGKPKVKKAKIVADNDENITEIKEQFNDVQHVGEGRKVDVDSELIEEESRSNSNHLTLERQLVHGYMKKNFITDKDGKKSKTTGRDDYIPCPDNIFVPIKDFYGLDDETFKEGQFMTRACGDAKVLYFMTRTIKSRFIDQGVQEKVTVVNAGLKAFVRNNKDSDVHYRVSQEGVHFVAPHMTKRKFSADLPDFEKCLSGPTIQIKELSAEFASEVRKLTVGSFVVCLKGHEDNYIKKLAVVLWRGRSDALNSLVTQAEIDGMKSKIRALSTEATCTETVE